jgi:hypothetical protein
MITRQDRYYFILLAVADVQGRLFGDSGKYLNGTEILTRSAMASVIGEPFLCPARFVPVTTGWRILPALYQLGL